MKQLMGVGSIVCLTALLSTGAGAATWVGVEDYPISAYQSGAVESGARIYVAGGFGTEALTNVYFAEPGADGSLTAWVAATPLPTADAGPGLAANNGWIYAALQNGNVYRAPVLADGALGEWSAEAAVSSSTAPYGGTLKAHNGYLYLFGRRDATAPRNVVRFAAINVDGSLGAWQSSTEPQPLYGASVNFLNGRVYVAGGVGAGDFPTEFTHSAPIEVDGSIGAWRMEATLPFPIYRQASVIITNQIFVIGGLTNLDQGSRANTIVQGTIGETGEISTWTVTETPPSGFSVGTAAVFSQPAANLYVIGGADAAQQTTGQAWRKSLGPIVVENRPPVAQAQTVSLKAGTSLAIILTGSDEDGDLLQYAVVDSPTNGTLSGTAPNVVYVPAAGFSGSDAFTFKVNDGKTDSAVVVVSIIVVSETNHPPVASAEVSPLFVLPRVSDLLVLAVRGQSATVVLDASGSTDADGDQLTYAWADNGTPIGTEALTSAVLPAGSHEIVVEVSDGTDSDVAAATIEVITPAQAAALIAGVVVDSSLSPNRKQPLLASLAAVEASFARGNFTAALNQLRAFELKVSQIAGRADRVLVQDLVTASRTLTNAVGSRRK